MAVVIIIIIIITHFYISFACLHAHESVMKQYKDRYMEPFSLLQDHPFLVLCFYLEKVA
jgi:hypothetical protein